MFGLLRFGVLLVCVNIKGSFGQRVWLLTRFNSTQEEKLAMNLGILSNLRGYLTYQWVTLKGPAI